MKLWVRSIGVLLLGLCPPFLSAADSGRTVGPRNKADKTPEQCVEEANASTDLMKAKIFRECLCRPFFPRIKARGLHEICLKGTGSCTTNINVTQTSFGCLATWPYETLTNAKGRTGPMEWRLTKVGTDTNTYSFDGNEGIGICEGSQNDPQQDLRKGMCVDPACSRFQLEAVNMRVKRLHFGIVVKDQNGKICRSKDPIIINKGN